LLGDSDVDAPRLRRNRNVAGLAGVEVDVRGKAPPLLNEAKTVGALQCKSVDGKRFDHRGIGIAQHAGKAVLVPYKNDPRREQIRNLLPQAMAPTKEVRLVVQKEIRNRVLLLSRRLRIEQYRSDAQDGIGLDDDRQHASDHRFFS